VSGPAYSSMRWTGGDGMWFLKHLPMLTTVALTLLLTLVLPQIMRRFRVPGVVGRILAGILLGPHLSGVLRVEGEFVAIFAEIGKLMLMFFAGFEIDFREFNRTKRQSAIFGALTFSLPFLGRRGRGTDRGLWLEHLPGRGRDPRLRIRVWACQSSRMPG